MNLNYKAVTAATLAPCFTREKKNNKKVIITNKLKLIDVLHFLSVEVQLTYKIIKIFMIRSLNN